MCNLKLCGPAKTKIRHGQTLFGGSNPQALLWNCQSFRCFLPWKPCGTCLRCLELVFWSQTSLVQGCICLNRSGSAKIGMTKKRCVSLLACGRPFFQQGFHGGSSSNMLEGFMAWPLRFAISPSPTALRPLILPRYRWCIHKDLDLDSHGSGSGKKCPQMKGNSYWRDLFFHFHD